jgi:hypothetical protein
VRERHRQHGELGSGAHREGADDHVARQGANDDAERGCE